MQKTGPTSSKTAPEQAVDANRAIDVPGSEPTATDRAQSEIGDIAATEAANDVGPAAVPQSLTEQMPEGDGTSPTAAVERLVVLSPAGPLLVEVAMSIAGRPPQEALEQLIDHVIDAADTNGDGEPSWEEVVGSRRFAYGQLGNAPIRTTAEGYEVIRNYDVNRNQRLDRWEVLPFLTRSQGGSLAFTLATANPLRGDGTSGSHLHLWLDADQDGRLSAGEIAAAPVRLKARDANDDELMYSRDFKTAEELMSTASMSPRSLRREMALRLGPSAEWERIVYGLEQYSTSTETSDSSATVRPGLLTQIDADGNGRWERHELTKLDDVPPHIVINAHFDQRDTQAGGTSTLSVSLAPELAFAAQTPVRSTNRAVVRLPGLNLTIYLADEVSSDNWEARARELLADADRNNNGYLDEEESPDGLPGPREALDADGDGRIYQAEIERFLADQQAAARTQIRLHVGDGDDALLSALDADGDGRFSAREVYGSTHALESFDQDGDGALSHAEVPASMLIVLGRGSSAMGPPAYSPTRQVQHEVPRWFQGMDENGDGDVSPREFLGQPHDFQRLDSDGDGFVEGTEAAAIAEDEPRSGNTSSGDDGADVSESSKQF